MKNTINIVSVLFIVVVLAVIITLATGHQDIAEEIAKTFLMLTSAAFVWVVWVRFIDDVIKK